MSHIKPTLFWTMSLFALWCAFPESASAFPSGVSTVSYVDGTGIPRVYTFMRGDTDRKSVV